MASGGDKEEDEFTCAICLEIYIKPVKIQCGHVFCTGCISDDSQLASPKCSLCREVYNPVKTRKDKELEKKMDKTKRNCSGCQKKFSLSKLNVHMSTCAKLAVNSGLHQFQPIAKTNQKHEVVNRSTFKCPYCGARNLDCEGLRKHCNQMHKNDTAPVTCPICASMPWGDPNYKSSDFLSHLNMRHKFEYGTYVDFHNNEDEVLRQVLEQSLMQK
ncbi:E3 ubiquitin-protein ligase RNF166-like [Antedon mediterranea]|uniref:E3 ubiquitin-protein ligase RNF166-like n=1 Tax=Antedon mediterranea TaxID=105859 RepID=UPI003AF8D6A4